MSHRFQNNFWSVYGTSTSILPDPHTRSYQYIVWTTVGADSGMGVTNVHIPLAAHALTVPVDGLYNVSSCVSTAAGSTPTLYTKLLVVGGESVYSQRNASQSVFEIPSQINTDLYLEAGDNIILYVATSSAVSLETGQDDTYLSLRRIK